MTGRCLDCSRPLPVGSLYPMCGDCRSIPAQLPRPVRGSQALGAITCIRPVERQAPLSSPRPPVSSSGFSPTNEQWAAARTLVERLRDKPVCTLTGAAGTGKTSLMVFLAELLVEQGWAVSWVAPTGAAARRLAEKVHAGVRTLHSTFYTQITERPDGSPDFAGVRDLQERGRVWICDEASMVGARLGRDFRQAVFGRGDPSRSGSRILYVGDREQLSPIDDRWDADFEHPDAVLDEVHRQAMDHAICRIATAIRRRQITRLPRENVEGEYRFVRGGMDLLARWSTEGGAEDRPIMVWSNKDRTGLNRLCRLHRGRFQQDRLLEPGDRTIILANNPVHDVMNGEILDLTAVRSTTFPEEGGVPIFEVNWDHRSSNRVPARVHPDTFGADRHSTVATVLGAGEARRAWLWLDDGYARTVHKMQGNEADRVAFYFSSRAQWAAEQAGPDELRRVLYTALTRARKEFWAVDGR